MVIEALGVFVRLQEGGMGAIPQNFETEVAGLDLVRAVENGGRDVLCMLAGLCG